MEIPPEGSSRIQIVVGILAMVFVALLVYSMVSQPDSNREGEIVAPPPLDPAVEIVQVQVSNGTVVEGLAGRMREYLREQGFDVLDVGNARTREVPQTVVLDRVGNRALALRVARALGLPDERVREELSTSLMLDVTVLIGADFTTHAPFLPTVEER